MISGKTIIYSDVNSVDPLVKDKHENLESVHQSVENILFTNFKEMPFIRDFGADLEGLLFEPMDSLTAFQIYHQIIMAIDTWDPRVIIDNANSYVKPNYDEQSYEVRLAYKVAGFGETSYTIRGGLDNRRKELVDR